MVISERYLDNTSTGIIQNTATLSHLSTNDRQILSTVINCYKDFFKEKLHSLYIRGSFVAERMYPLHDIDSFAITTEKISSEEAELFSEKLKALSRAISVKIDDSTIDLITLKTDRGVGYYRSFEIKTQSVCIYGNDLTASLPQFIVSKQLAMNLLDDIPYVLEKAERKVSKAQSNDEMKRICGWLMKRCVRNAYLLILAEVGRFTRDIHTCSVQLQSHFPEYTEMFKNMELWSIDPTGNQNEIKVVSEQFFLWYQREVSKFITSEYATSNRNSTSNLHF